MSNDPQTVQASDFDSNIVAVDKRIEKLSKQLEQAQKDRDALVRAKSLICGKDSVQEQKKDEERDAILAILAEGPMYYKDITTRLNDRLGISKKVETVYAKLDRMSKEDEPVIVKVGDGKFDLPNKQDGTKEGASSKEGVAPSTDSKSVDAIF